MKRLLLIPLLGAALALAPGCGDDDKVETDTSTTDTADTTVADTADATTTDTGGGGDTATDTGGGDTTENPAPPALGTLVDRLGRPGVSTALIGTFESDATTKGALKDSYNQAEMADWGDFSAEIAKNLGIYDGADATCGNQLLAAEALSASRYAALAGALTDDRIYVDTSRATCTTYLAVEANATGLIPNTDCGGRGLGYDVIDITYSALTVGALSGVTDGVDADDGHPSAEFPYLAAPGPAWPGAPLLGSLVDRLGRPGVSTALIGTFNSDATAKGALKDAYNEAEMDDWGDFTAEIQANLGIYDGADATCGNQLLANETLSASRYALLAGALTDDRIYVNTGGATCTTYLAVEANATGLVPNSDCGGRAPAYDVIDVTYSALTTGALTGVGDNVPADDASPPPSTTTFPYLVAAPVAQQ